MNDDTDIRWKNLLVAQALKKLFQPDGYFDVSAVTGIAKVLGGVLNPKDKEELNLLHCVHYKDMHPDLLNELPRRVTDALSSVTTLNVDDIIGEYMRKTSFEVKDVTPQTAPQKRNPLLRLINYHK